MINISKKFLLSIFSIVLSSSFAMQDQRQEQSSISCALCKQPLIGAIPLEQLPCQHVYHKKCIDSYLKKFGYKCPGCHKKIKVSTKKNEDGAAGCCEICCCFPCIACNMCCEACCGCCRNGCDECCNDCDCVFCKMLCGVLCGCCGPCKNWH